MNVLHIAPFFWPATYWGGPVVTNYSLCNRLAAMPGINIKVLTVDAAGPRVSQRVRVDKFPIRFPAGFDVYFTRRVFGRGVAPGLLLRLLPMIRWADVVHLHDVYSFPTIPTLLLCRVWRKPLVWSPHGALKTAHDWQDTRRPRLKKIWEGVCNAILPERCVLHVMSEAERTATLARLPKATAVVVPNGVDFPRDMPTRQWRPNGTMRVLYVGRISREKAIENLLAALGHLNDDSITLDVCGAGDNRYFEDLHQLRRSLRLVQRVNFRGHVDREAKLRAFLEADVCVVPSHSESFAMVVAEALAHGVPVIASTGTPWAELEEKGCGLWVDNTPTKLAEVIRRFRSMDLPAMGERGRSWMERNYAWETIAARYKSLYNEIADKPILTSLN